MSQQLGSHRRNCPQSSFNQSVASTSINATNQSVASTSLNVANQLHVSMRPSLSVNSTLTESQGSQVKKKFVPTVCCGIKITTATGMTSHLRGKKHLSNQSLASQPLQYPEPDPIKCSNCNEEFFDDACLAVHVSTCK